MPAAFWLHRDRLFFRTLLSARKYATGWSGTAIGQNAGLLPEEVAGHHFIQNKKALPTACNASGQVSLTARVFGSRFETLNRKTHNSQEFQQRPVDDSEVSPFSKCWHIDVTRRFKLCDTSFGSPGVFVFIVET